MAKQKVGAKLVQGGMVWQWKQFRFKGQFCKASKKGAKPVVLRRRNMPGGR